MKAKSSAQVRVGNGYTFVKLRGTIDEDNQLSALRRELASEVIILDLGEIDRINSYGVRDWVNWLGELRAAGHKVALIRCSTAIVAQANMVTNFCAGAAIVSFFAPYYNPAKDESCEKLLYVEDFLGAAELKAPAFYDDATGTALDFDDFEESYFAFIRSMDGAGVDERLQQFLAEASPDLVQRIRALHDPQGVSGPVHTANLHSVDHPRSGAFPGLVSSTRDAERAVASPPPRPAPPPPSAPPHGAPNVVPAGMPPRPAPPAAGPPPKAHVASHTRQGLPPAAKPSDDGDDTQVMDSAMVAAASKQSAGGASRFVWVPFVLVFVALLVVALLLYLVLTIQ
jgi:anti-anti-sigma regulatory factor